MLPLCSALANVALLIFIWCLCLCVCVCVCVCVFVCEDAGCLGPNHIKACFSCEFWFALAVSLIHQDEQFLRRWAASYSLQSAHVSLMLWGQHGHIRRLRLQQTGGLTLYLHETPQLQRCLPHILRLKSRCDLYLEYKWGFFYWNIHECKSTIVSVFERQAV